MRDGAGTRHRIQHCALALFVAQGVSETSVRDLAAAAGIAEGTLYRHYASKDELVADLFGRNYAAFAGQLRTALDRRSTFAGQLSAIIAEVCRFFDEDPTLFRFLLLVSHQALPRFPDGVANPVDVVKGAVAAAMEAGEIPPGDPELATALLLGLLLQPATSVVYGRLAGPLSAHAGAITHAAARTLGLESFHA
jgi:AcrR family transcriptional regulator